MKLVHENDFSKLLKRFTNIRIQLFQNLRSYSKSSKNSSIKKTRRTFYTKPKQHYEKRT